MYFHSLSLGTGGYPTLNIRYDFYAIIREKKVYKARRDTSYCYKHNFTKK